jgi:hypothetical protein
MNFSNEFVELAGALAGAQGKFAAIPRGRRNPQTQKEYATLDDLFNMIRLPLSEAALCYTQSPRLEPAVEGRPPMLVMVTRIIHKSGQWIEGEYPVPIKPLSFKGSGEDAQSYGSAGTYGRRYGLMAILGIAPGDETDDDGNAASGRNGEQERGEPGRTEAHTERASSAATTVASVACPACHAPAGKPHAAACKGGQSQQIPTETAKNTAATQVPTETAKNAASTRNTVLGEFQALPNMPPGPETRHVFESCLRRRGVVWDWESPTIVPDIEEATRIFTARNEARAALMDLTLRSYGEPVTDDVLRGILHEAGFADVADLWSVSKKQWNEAFSNLENRRIMAQSAVDDHGRPDEVEEEGPLVVPPAGAGY